MEMKFHQLRPGQRFQWQGETFEKLNPLLACSTESGTQRMVPRSTPVSVLADGTATPPPAATRQIPDTQAIGRAFEDYHRSSLYWLERSDGTAEAVAQAHQALAMARERFLAVLEGGGKTASAFPDGNAD
jgi:hypothetical protein